MFKKSLLTLVIALTLMSGVSKAHAYSLEDAMADIASLKTQITELKDQLSAAVITTKASSTVTAVPVITEPVVSTEKTVTFSSSANIIPNQKGDDVKVLQQALKDKGYFTAEVTGTFGAKTERAVIEFQKANKISATGVVGSATKSLLTTPTGNTCAPTATFLPASSTTSRYIDPDMYAVDSTTQLVYKITIPSSCHSIKITELKLSNTGTPGVITSASIGSVTVPFAANNIANFAGLNLNVPNTPAGLTVTVTLSYPMVGVNGIPSGTVSSKVKLTYLKYTNMTTGVSSAVNTSTAPSPNMMLVKTKPTTFHLDNSPIGIPTVLNGSSNIAYFSLENPWSPGGQADIKIKSIPIEIKIEAGNVGILNTAANSVVVKDEYNNNIYPTTHNAFVQINPTTFATTINFTQPVVIQSNSGKAFSIFATFSGVPLGGTIPPTVVVRTKLGSPDKFSWIDVNGANNSAPFTSANATYLQDYYTGFSQVNNYANI
ncbi:peptidoglycan-binding protein [Candidatus Nomurabacteria bacterium]|nr:peptidoglycan-binding protein [Candidatus Nomurabacteria bacterium]